MLICVCLGSAFQNQGLLENIVWVLTVDVVEDLDFLPYTKKNGVSAVAKFSVTLTGEHLIQIPIPVSKIFFTKLL